MPQNNQKIVYKGGWEELENLVFADDSGALQSVNSSSGLYIKPDGRFVYIADTVTQTINQYQLSIPWDASSIASVPDKFDVSADIDEPMNVSFSPDGTVMFVTEGEVITPGVRRYDVPIPFDISSIVGGSTSVFNIGGSIAAHTVIFESDGFNFFVTTDVVTKYNTETAFDFGGVNIVDIFTPSVTATVVAFKQQGDKMYVGGGTENIIEYDLSAPFDISAPVDTGNFLDPAQALVDGFVFRPNGTQFFTLHGQGFDVVFKHHLDEEWNISTASIFGNQKLVGTSPTALNWKHDGSKMILLDEAALTVTDFSTPNPWNVSTTTLDNVFDVSIAAPLASGMDWRPNGTRCYILGTSGKLTQFNVATPWDVSTMSDSGISHTFTGLNNIADVFFRPDGKKVYVAHFGTPTPEEVTEFDLSVAWDITTIGAAVNTLDVAANSQDPSGITFKLDGKMMYLTTALQLVTRYVLSVPWDISTGVFADSFNTSAQDTDLEGLFIRQHDGKKLFVSGKSTGTVYCYDMSAEFNNTIITSLGDDLVDDTGAVIVHTS